MTGNSCYDPAVESLIRRAREARSQRAEGFGSFEMTFRERIYVGLRGDVVRRERAMYHQERAARIHWMENGDRVIRWLGARAGVPIAGIAIDFDEPDAADFFDTDFDFIDPGTDKMFLGSDWAIHPLAEDADNYYRYRSGDTLRIQLSGLERMVTLVEAIVEPRESRFDLVAASMWFDDETAVLVRAAYRPARPFDLEVDEPEDAEDVPGFLKPIRASIDFVTIDYGLQELRWWLPNRMAFDGFAQVAGLAQTPIRMEWLFDDYVIDGPEALDPGDALAEGWTRTERTAEPDSVWRERRREAWRNRRDRGDDAVETDIATAEADSLDAEDEEDRPRVVVIIPPSDSLRESQDLLEPFMGGESVAFSEDEIAEVRDRLGRVAMPTTGLPGPRFNWGLGPGLIRFNRVEGLSPGVRFDVGAGQDTHFETSARIGIGEWEPYVEAGVFERTTRGSIGFNAYRRLVDVGDWGRPLGFGNSLNSFFFGYDSGMYFQPSGAEVIGSRVGTLWRVEGRVFLEYQRSSSKSTDVSLPNLFGDNPFPDNMTADKATQFGTSGRLRLFSGMDPAKLIASATIWGEAASGDFEYGRLAAQGAMSVPLFWRLLGAIEAGAGTTFGSPSTQRLYYLGGPYTLRGFEMGSTVGEAFWLGRAELGYGFKVTPMEETQVGGAFRVVGFADFGWAGPRDAFGTEGYRAAVGAGLSILDGLFRLDFAKAVHGGNDFWVDLYADGLM
jgi:hypothetical protein